MEASVTVVSGLLLLLFLIKLTVLLIIPSVSDNPEDTIKLFL